MGRSLMYRRRLQGTGTVYTLCKLSLRLLLSLLSPKTTCSESFTPVEGSCLPCIVLPCSLLHKFAYESKQFHAMIRQQVDPQDQLWKNSTGTSVFSVLLSSNPPNSIPAHNSATILLMSMISDVSPIIFNPHGVCQMTSHSLHRIILAYSAGVRHYKL